MPVLPLVGSMSTVLPGWIFPERSASSIMLTPMRSFTLESGFWLSSLATTWAAQPLVTLFSRTIGVLPINCVTSFAIFIARGVLRISRSSPLKKRTQQYYQYDRHSAVETSGRRSHSSGGSAVGQAVGHGSSGRSDTHVADDTFHFVMASLVEEVADRHHARSLADKIDGKSSRRTSEDTDHRVQFLTAAVQVRIGNGEVGAIQGGGHQEECLVFAIPKFMRTSLGARQRNEIRSWFDGGVRHRRIRDGTLRHCYWTNTDD